MKSVLLLSDDKTRAAAIGHKLWSTERLVAAMERAGFPDVKCAVRVDGKRRLWPTERLVAAMERAGLK